MAHLFSDLTLELKGKPYLKMWRVTSKASVLNVPTMYGFVVKKPETCKWAKKSYKWIAYVISYELFGTRVGQCHLSETFKTKMAAEKYIKDLEIGIEKRG